MGVPVLLGVMGTLCVIAVYFWLVRNKSEKTPQTPPQ